MSYCINPQCPQPINSVDFNHNQKKSCPSCGSDLLLQGKYQVIEQLGKGGFGTTYLVLEQGQERVLKVLNLDKFQSVQDRGKVVELFAREARILSDIKNSGIPQVRPGDYFRFLPHNNQEALYCLVMDKIEGLNLEEWVKKNNNQRISETQAIAWLKQIVVILQEVHQKNYMHRDIKPSNIMLKQDQHLALIDFGAVREITETYLHNQRGTGVASPGFTPREQMEGKAVYQSDFFALGRTFVYLLTAKFPNNLPENPRTGKLIWRDHAPQISAQFAGLIDYLMEPFPGKRPQNTQEISRCLEEIESGLANFPTTVISNPKREVPKIRERNDHSRIATNTPRRTEQGRIAKKINQKKIKIIQQIGWGLLGSYGLIVAFNPQILHIFWFINLTLGGMATIITSVLSFGQILPCFSIVFSPLIVAIANTAYFNYHQKRNSSSLALFWTSFCFFDIYAIFRGLRLTDVEIEGNIPGFCVLQSLGLLNQSYLVSNLFYFCGFVSLIVSVFAAFYYLQNPTKANFS